MAVFKGRIYFHAQLLAVGLTAWRI